MTDAAVTAAFSTMGAALLAALGVLGRVLLTRPRNGNGNGKAAATNVQQQVQQVLSERDQFAMKLAVDGLSKAFEQANDKTLERMATMTDAMTEAASAIHGVHEEIKAHREASMPAIVASLETAKLVREIHQSLTAPVPMSRR